MKALILGASGFFGSVVAKRLHEGGVFDGLVLASRDVAKLAPLTSEIGDGATATELDLLDDAALRAALKGVDVVVNAAGAALDTAVPVMASAASSKVSYCDIAAEVGVLLQAERLEQEQDLSGSILLVGAGFHPGVLDLLGRCAISALDEAHGVELFIVGNFPDYGDAAGFVGMFEGGWQGTEGLKTILAGVGLPATVLTGGVRKAIEPGTESRIVTSPDGFDIDFTYFASLEPLALARSHGSLSGAAIRYGAWPSDVYGPLRENARKAMSGEMGVGDALKSVFTAALKKEDRDPKIHFWAEASGLKDGRETKMRAYSNQEWASNGQMLSTTTRVLCFAAEKLAKGEVSQTGLVTAADVLSPEEVFEHLAGGRDTGLIIEEI
jgi:saccharopine dehydrogenase-like NADP-dependent oxidoreductase